MIRLGFTLSMLVLASLCTETFAQPGDVAKTAKQDAERLYRQGDLEGAIASFTRSLEANPEQAGVRLRRGDAFAGLGKLNRAISEYTEAMEHLEDDSVALMRRAYAWRALKMYNKALDDLRAALNIHADHPQALKVRESLLYRQGDYSGALRDGKRLVLFDDDWTGANLRVANAHYARDDYSSAVQAYDRALLSSADLAHAWYWSAMAEFALGHHDAAIERIQELIRTNPEQGGGYARRSHFSRELTAADLEYGRKQVEQLLKDRPEMARYPVTPDDEIVAWTTRKFAGEDVPGRIIWDGSSPGDAWADHSGPRRGKSARVRVSKSKPSAIGSPGRPFEFEEQWCMLAYELHNVQSFQRFAEIAELARDGYLTREGFVREYTRLEYHALLRTRAWYLDCYRPWATKRGLESNTRIWRIDLPLTFDEFMEDHEDKTQYPWVPYLNYFDQIRKSQRQSVNDGKDE